MKHPQADLICDWAREQFDVELLDERGSWNEASPSWIPTIKYRRKPTELEWKPKLGDICLFGSLESLWRTDEFKEMDWATQMYVTKGNTRYDACGPHPIQIAHDKYKKALEEIRDETANIDEATSTADEALEQSE